jgi:hypothetical protein
MKKPSEVPAAVKAVRKMPTSSPAATAYCSQSGQSQNQNKKKVSTKKELSTPTHNQACIVLNKVSPSPKERVEERTDRGERVEERVEKGERKGENALRSDLSAVDHK